MNTLTKQALSNISGSIADQLSPWLETHAFCGFLPAELINQVQTNLGLDRPSLMQGLLPFAATFAKPEVSDFYVGVVLEGASGNWYLGANLELPGLSLNNSLHGEQSAIANAWNQDEKSLRSLAVNASPCGHCRQFIRELAGLDKLTVYIPNTQGTEIHTLLPDSFGPQDLGVSQALLSHPQQTMQLNTADPLVQTALAQANLSYAPYTQSYAAVVLLAEEQTFIGRYAENAAFNPSLSPLQAALSQLALHGLTFAQIERVALVENEKGKISHTENTATALASVSKVELEVYQAS